ncbi:MAG: hypothetical protein ACRDKH_04455 [Solirubrobacterales bacterium]
MRGNRLAAVLAAAVLALLAGCGEGREFSAEEFVDAVNAEGVELRLGSELVTDQADKQLYAVELEPVAQLPGGSGHAGGSIGVLDDSDAADAELASCEAAADLLCYRAGNVVVVLEGGGIEAQQLGVAIERVAEE